MSACPRASVSMVAGLPVLMNTNQLSGRNALCVRIAKSVVDIGDAIDADPLINMTMPIDMDAGPDLPDLLLKPLCTQNRIHDPMRQRDKTGHEVDARQKV